MFWIWCWIFGCNYQDAIGGGWCVVCGYDGYKYRGPIWKRLAGVTEGKEKP